MQVHLLDYNDDTGILDRTTFSHPAGNLTLSPLVSYCMRCLSRPGEVWDIAACPTDSGMVATVFSSVSIEGVSGGVGVWRMEGEGGEGEGGTLEEVCKLSHDGMPRW